MLRTVARDTAHSAQVPLPDNTEFNIMA